MSIRLLCVALLLAQAACISPSVLEPEDHAPCTGFEDRVWRPALESDIAGTYVSEQLSGQLAIVLRMVVYRFEAEGTYTGAALLDDDPPHFEVISGSWQLDQDSMRLDDGPAAQAQVDEYGSLRLNGPDGTVIMRRERPQ